MFNSSSRAPKTGNKWNFIIACSAVFLLSLGIFGVSKAEMSGSEPEHRTHNPKIYSISVDPANKAKIGQAELDQLGAFFDYADNAIKTKDMRALGSLYSDRYKDGMHTKDDVMKIWKRLFDDFDNLKMTHNLRFIHQIEGKNVVILQCSGVLMGSKKGEDNLQGLDHWINLSHVLSKENTGWKIVGSYGVEENRFWFDKPMHPLF